MVNKMKFTKMQGCGNDYVYINCFEEQVTDPEELAIRLSDRRTGIGSDGVILIKPSERADFFMDMYNLDGSRGKMCGNGIRCVGKYVYDHRLTASREITVETLSGIKYLSLCTDASDRVTSVTVNMGAPITEPKLIPLNTDIVHEFRLGTVLSTEYASYAFTFVSMGNPHAVTFVDAVDSLELEKIGPGFEHHKAFPELANIEFIRVIDRSHLQMRVWERGSGETFACGTGACASAYAAILNGLTDDEVTVSLLGGDLTIRFDREQNTIYMTGPAVEVYNGEITL